jgi:hypothetical protein
MRTLEKASGGAFPGSIAFDQPAKQVDVYHLLLPARGWLLYHPQFI